MSIYKICAQRQGCMWSILAPLAFQVFHFLVKFSLKLGKIQEEKNSTLGGPSNKHALCLSLFLLQVDDTTAASLQSKMQRLHNKADVKLLSVSVCQDKTTRKKWTFLFFIFVTLQVGLSWRAILVANTMYFKWESCFGFCPDSWEQQQALLNGNKPKDLGFF